MMHKTEMNGWYHLIPCLGALLLAICCSTAFADAIDNDLNAQWSRQNVPAYVGQQVFSAANRFELALNVGVVPNDDFYTYFPIALDVHYRFTPSWGLMLRGSLLMAHVDSSLSKFMDAHQSAIASEMLADEQKGDITLVATFHPVYGKWTLSPANANLGRFDWGIFAGIGVVFSDSVNDSRTQRDLAAHVQGAFGMDAHFFFLDWLALHLEAGLRFYKAPSQWMVPCHLSVGVSFFLPSIGGNDE